MNHPYTSDSFPTVPSSLSAGDHGMRDYRAAQGRALQRPAAHSLDDITPYLGLRARLSQVWINRWTVLILLVLARVLIGIGDLRDRVDAAEAQALSACTTVESMGSAMASMPFYMAQGTNHLAARGVEKAVNGLEQMLFMSITALEEIFVFVVNVLYGTYECLLTFAIGGSAHVAVQVAGDVTKFLNQTLGDIGGDIQKGVGAFTTDFNSFLSGLSSIPNIFGGHVDPPKIDLSAQIAALSDVKLPDSINEGLDKLNASIPDFSQVQNFTNNVLRLPFEEVKKLINESLGPFTFNESVFPVPQKESLSFCKQDNGIADFFGSLYDLADTARKIFIAVLLVAAVLACVPMAWTEIRRWRTMQQRAKLVQDNSRDPLDVIYIASRPYTASAGIKLSRNFSSRKRQLLTRWVVAYATSTPALLVLAIALAGFLSCLCQYLLLQAVKKEVPALATQIGAFAEQVVTKLDNASAAWANGTNAEILKVNNDINQNVFGWVNTSTTALNDTLNTFINDTTKIINDTFGGTVLQDPVQQIFNCLIGLKAQNIEKGLTWIHDNAHIDFPLFPNNTFSEGASKALAHTDNSTGTNSAGDSFLADPDSGASDKVTAAVIGLTDKLTEGIRTEALISTAVFLIWVLIVLIGLSRALFLFCRREKIRGEGGVSFAGDLADGGHDLPDRNGNELYTFTDSQPRQGQPVSAYLGTHISAHAPPYEERRYSPSQRNESIERDENDMQEKVGFAGLREPAASRNGAARGVMSEYGVVEDEKPIKF